MAGPDGEDAAPRAATRSSRRVSALIAVWLASVVTGMGVLLGYSFTPGRAADAPELWPAESSLGRGEGRYTLVLAAHPGCSCTRATLAELAWVMERVGRRADAHVLFMKPVEFSEEWSRSDLFDSAAAIPHVRVSIDEGGVEASRFGARTSGQVYLYDPAGVLRFRGGITPSRSHQGDNVGRQRILAVVHGEGVERDSANVYGCALDEDQDGPFWLAALRSYGDLER